MKEKTVKALRGLLKDVAKHEAESGGPDVTVDLADLKRVLRWAQNSAHVWFIGDRVILTGASVPFRWLEDTMVGTVVEESLEDGKAKVEWAGGPAGKNSVWMFHNEIRRVK